MLCYLAYKVDLTSPNFIMVTRTRQFIDGTRTSLQAVKLYIKRREGGKNPLIMTLILKRGSALHPTTASPETTCSIIKASMGIQRSNSPSPIYPNFPFPPLRAMNRRQSFLQGDKSNNTGKIESSRIRGSIRHRSAEEQDRRSQLARKQAKRARLFATWLSLESPPPTHTLPSRILNPSLIHTENLDQKAESVTQHLSEG